MNTLLSIIRRDIVCVAVVALFWPGSTVQADMIANARDDFVAGVSAGDLGILSATGTGTWNYLASDTVNPTLAGSLDPLTWNGFNGYYSPFVSGSANAVDLTNAITSDEIRVHPSGQDPKYAVVRWITGVGEAGLTNITGNVRKVDAGGGDGVTFDLFVDGISVLNSTLAYNDTVGLAFNQTLTVGVGSTVDFVIGPNGWDTHDSTGLSVAVSSVVPIPGAVLLGSIGLSFSGWLLRKRKML